MTELYALLVLLVAILVTTITCQYGLLYSYSPLTHYGNKESTLHRDITTYLGNESYKHIFQQPFSYPLVVIIDIKFIITLPNYIDIPSHNRCLHGIEQVGVSYCIM